MVSTLLCIAANFIQEFVSEPTPNDGAKHLEVAHDCHVEAVTEKFAKSSARIPNLHKPMRSTASDVCIHHLHPMMTNH